MYRESPSAPRRCSTQWLDPLDNLRQLLGVEIAGIVALVLVSLGAALLLPLMEHGLYANAFNGTFRGWFLGITIVGTPVAVVYGAPAYFLLRKYSLARWGYVVALGALPACVFFAMAPLAGVLGLLCGVAIASLTHMMCRNRV